MHIFARLRDANMYLAQNQEHGYISISDQVWSLGFGDHYAQGQRKMIQDDADNAFVQFATGLAPGSFADAFIINIRSVKKITVRGIPREIVENSQVTVINVSPAKPRLVTTIAELNLQATDIYTLMGRYFSQRSEDAGMLIEEVATITRFPKYMMVKINRNTGAQINPARVDFPVELDMARFGYVDVIYTLHWLLIRLGTSTRSGHYFFVKRVGGRWIQFDDREVTDITDIGGLDRFKGGPVELDGDVRDLYQEITRVDSEATPAAKDEFICSSCVLNTFASVLVYARA
jgi:hypothetical protein